MAATIPSTSLVPVQPVFGRAVAGEAYGVVRVFSNTIRSGVQAASTAWSPQLRSRFGFPWTTFIMSAVHIVYPHWTVT